MRIKQYYFAAFTIAALIFVSCKNSMVNVTDRGVIVRVGNKDNNPAAPKLVRLAVEGEKIIRVTATTTSKFADPQSLIIIDRKVDTPFDVGQKGDTVTLTTDALKAHVLISTGEVSFYDAGGNVILQEQQGGGKTFSPYETTQTKVEGEEKTYKGWTTRTVFESPDDEAFYGLGNRICYCKSIH